MPLLEFLEDDDVTPIANLAFPNVEAGQDSDSIIEHAWNQKGNPGGQALQNAILIQQTASLIDPNRFLSSDTPPQDELWGRARIVGYDNSGDPTWSVDDTAWYSVGAWSGMPIGTIPADCAVYIERKLHPPSTAAPLLTYRILDAIAANEYARPLPTPLTLLERGILPLTGDRVTAVILRGCDVTPSGAPDDEVHVGFGMWQHAGRAAGKISTDHTLNQSDGAAAALVAPESYIAVISLDASGVVVTKGAKAVSPVAPTVPAGNAFLRWVLVAYQVGGTSVIDAADITGTPWYGRHLVTAATGTNVLMHRGQAIAGGAWRFWTGARPIALTDDADNFIWQLASGHPDVNTTGIAPDAAALPIAKVPVAGGVVGTIEDLRLYAGRSVTFRLKRATPAIAAQLDDVLSEHPDLDIEEIALRVSNQVSLGAGSAGETKVDVLIDGVSIFTSSATEDLRPAIAFDAPVLITRAAIPEVTRVVRGNVLSVEMVDVPTGESPAECEVLITCRVP